VIKNRYNNGVELSRKKKNPAVCNPVENWKKKKNMGDLTAGEREKR
jgi:hypothetical protein